MERVDMAEVLEHAPANFDLLVFVYNGNAGGGDETNLLFIIQDTNANNVVSKLSDMEEAGFMCNGCVQLAMTQVAYRDTTMTYPIRYLVSNGNGGWCWLHDVEVWDSDKYLIKSEGGNDDGRDFTPPYEP